MSVINQMLRDLDARHAEAQPTDQAALRGLAVGGQVSRRRSAALVWTLLVVVIALAGTLVHVVAGERSSLPSTAVEPVAPLAALPQVPQPVPTEVVAAAPQAPQPAPHEVVAAPAAADQPKAVAVVHAPREPAPAPDPPRAQAPKPPQVAKLPSPKLANVGEPVAVDAKMEKQRRALPPAQQVEDAIAQASGAIRGGDRETAERALGTALSIAPGHTGARELLAKVYIASGRVVEARALLAEGIRRHPEHAGLRKLQARVLVEQGEIGAAVSLLNRDHPAVARDAEYWALLAGLAYQHADYSTARLSYRELVDHQPGAGTWWLGLGMTAEAQQDEKTARDAYARAAQGDGLSPALKLFAKSRLSASPDPR